MERIKGAYGIILTPYKPDGSIDYNEMQRQVDYVCRTGIRGLVACGSTGECAQLSPQENMDIMSAVAEAIDGRKPLVCGATAGDVKTSQKYLSHMAKLGACGALTAPSYYFPLSDEDVLEFYKEAAHGNSGVPIVAYHIPQFSSGISLPVYEKLLEIPEICAIKNSSGNINFQMQMVSLRNERRPDFSVLTGSDEALLASLSVGCDGNFTALAFLLPELTQAIYDRFAANSGALDCQMASVPLIRFSGTYPFPVGYKLIGEARGFRFGPYRQPLSARLLERFDADRHMLRETIRGIYEKFNLGQEDIGE